MYYIFEVMIVQMKQKTLFWKIWLCIFKDRCCIQTGLLSCQVWTIDLAFSSKSPLICCDILPFYHQFALKKIATNNTGSSMEYEEDGTTQLN